MFFYLSGTKNRRVFGLLWILTFDIFRLYRRFRSLDTTAVTPNEFSRENTRENSLGVCWVSLDVGGQKLEDKGNSHGKSWDL